MNLGSKELGDLLSKWPAVRKGSAVTMGEHDDDAQKWEERADAIVKAALAAKDQAVSAQVTDTLFAAPALAAEPGEEAGGKSMSQEKEAGEAGAKSDPPAPRPSVPPGDRKRPSLKEIAARASQSGARPQSSPGAVPPPSAARSESARPPSVTPLPRPPSSATPLPRPVEAGKDDSGVINLKVVQESATAAQVAAAEKAKPAQAGLFEDEKTVESPENPAQKPAAARPANVAVLQPKKSNAGPIAGVVIAVLGIAAAFAIVSKKPPVQQPPAAVAEVKPADKPATPTQAATPAPTATAAAVASSEPSPAATAEASAKPGEAPARVAAATPTGAATSTGADAPSAAQAAKGAASAAPGKPGDLQNAIVAAAGGSKDTKSQEDAVAPTPEPASGKSQTIPEQPSQGAVQGALGPVLGAAKACVVGADDVSRATVTFASNGSVTTVSVSGWAASHGKSACVQAALKGAKTGPFSKSSFTVGVPIRP